MTSLARRQLLRGGVILTAAGILTGCRPGGSADGFPSELRVGTMAPYVELAILEREGILADVITQAGQEASVTYQPLLSMVPMATAVAGGSLDFGHSASPVAAIAAGQRISLVATFERSVSGSGILVGKGSGITVAADLKGKRIGSPAGTPSRQLKVVLDSAGLTFDDVELKALEANVGVAGLKSGAVDAYSAFDPYYTQAILEGHADEFDLGDLNLRSFIPVSAHSKFVERHPQAVEVYLRALHRAIAWSYDNPERTSAIYAEVNKITGELATATLKNRERKLSVPGEEYQQELVAEAEFLKSIGSIDAVPDFSKSIHTAAAAAVVGN